MVWVVPAPMLSSLIVIKQYPLHSLKIGKKHLMQIFLPSWILQVKLKFLEVVLSFGLIGVIFVSGGESFHKLMILLNIFIRFILLKLHL